MPLIQRYKHAILPSAHLFPFGGCYDSHVSGSPASAFVRRLGRDISEFNFTPTSGLLGLDHVHLCLPRWVTKSFSASRVAPCNHQSCINCWDFPGFCLPLARSVSIKQASHPHDQLLCLLTLCACSWPLPGEPTVFGCLLWSRETKLLMAPLAGCSHLKAYQHEFEF